MESDDDRSLEKQRKAWDMYRRKVREKWNKSAVDTMMRVGTNWNANEKRNLHHDMINNAVELIDEIRRNRLSTKEQQFADAFMSQKFFIVHASDINLIKREDLKRQFNQTKDEAEKAKRDMDKLFIGSRRYLVINNIKFPTNHSTLKDIDGLGNADYVFFSLEVGNRLQKTYSKFGKIFYRIPYVRENIALRYSSITLADQLECNPQSNKMIKGLSDKTRKYLSERIFTPYKIMFSGFDNCLRGLLYSIISVTRYLEQDEYMKKDAEKILQARNDDEMNRVINGLFRPEIRVPRMFSAGINEYQVIRKY
jgi:hypothetical protein